MFFLIILVSANCTDKLQPLDLSVIKPAKEQMRHQFQEWYGEMICTQLDNEVQHAFDRYETSLSQMDSVYPYMTV